MYIDVMDHPCELSTYSKLFFILVVKTTYVRLDSLTMGVIVPHVLYFSLYM